MNRHLCYQNYVACSRQQRKLRAIVNHCILRVRCVLHICAWLRSWKHTQRIKRL